MPGRSKPPSKDAARTVHELTALSLAVGPSVIERLLLNEGAVAGGTKEEAIKRGVLEALNHAWKRARRDDARDRLVQAAEILCGEIPIRHPRCRNWVADLLLETPLAMRRNRQSLHLRRWAAVHKAHYSGDELPWPQAFDAASERLKDEPEAGKPRTMRESYDQIAKMGRQKIR
jgi:hypothetical protein